jgi:hypothetical protein
MKQVLRNPQWWAVLIALVALSFSIYNYVQSKPYQELGAFQTKLTMLEERLGVCQWWVTRWEEEDIDDTSVDEMKTNLIEAEAKLNAARGEVISGRWDLANKDIEDANELLDEIPSGPHAAIRGWVWIAIALGCILIVSLTILIVRRRKNKT